MLMIINRFLFRRRTCNQFSSVNYLLIFGRDRLTDSRIALLFKTIQPANVKIELCTLSPSAIGIVIGTSSIYNVCILIKKP